MMCRDVWFVADNAADYTTWDREQLSPALAQIPLTKLGAGLGCWIDSRTKGTWNVKPQSAIDRVCLLMNKSVRVPPLTPSTHTHTHTHTHTQDTRHKGRERERERP